MNTKLIGLVSVILGTIRKARGIEMRPGTLARATLALLLLSAWGAASAHGDEQRVPHVRPLVFEANRGQADEQVKFLARGAGYTVFLTSTDAVVSLRDRNGRSERAVVRVKPVGASAAARIVADGELPGVVNYARRAAGARSHQRSDVRAGEIRRRLSRRRSRVLRPPAPARVRFRRSRPALIPTRSR